MFTMPACPQASEDHQSFSGVGHKRVGLAPEVYDRATLDEKRQALGVVGKELLPIGSNSGSVQ